MNNLNNEGFENRENGDNRDNHIIFVNPENMPPPVDNMLMSRDILEISKDFFPSFIVIVFIIISNNQTENYCDESMNTIIKASLIFHSIFVINSMAKIFFISLELKPYLRYSVIAADYTFNTIYYIFVIYAYVQYKKLPDDCLYSNTFSLIIVFSLITLGLLDLVRHTFDFLLILIGFPVMLYYFFRDPGDFIRRFGVDPEIIDNWPTMPATAEQSNDCVICSEQITQGQNIMILNCQGRHYYHAPCIKEWLKHRVNCPVCRSNNVF